MKKFKVSKISFQALVNILILIVAEFVFYSISNDQVFYLKESILIYLNQHYFFLVYGLLLLFMVYFQWAFSSKLYFGFLTMFFFLGAIDFYNSNDILVFIILILLTVVGFFIGVFLSFDEKSSYRKGRVDGRNLVLAPKKQIFLKIQKGKDNQSHQAFLTNWDRGSGFFHLLGETAIGLGIFKATIEWSGVEFGFEGEIVKIKVDEMGHGFIVTKALSPDLMTWHNFVNLLEQLGYSPELVV